MQIQKGCRTEKSHKIGGVGRNKPAILNSTDDDIDNVLAKPGPPVNLTVTSSTETSVSLKWEEPKSDGGSPVTGYVVEQRVAAKKTWNKVDTTSSMEYTVGSLSGGSEYVLHVAAQNEVGVGDFVEITQAVRAQPGAGELSS